MSVWPCRVKEQLSFQYTWSPTPCSQQSRPWTRKRDFLPTQCIWLTVGPSCTVFNHQEGTRSSATSDRSCPCLRTEHLWPSSGSLLTVVFEAMRKQTGGQNWEASWSNLHTPFSYSEAKTILRNNFRTEWRQPLDIGTEEDSIHQLDRAAQVTICRLRSGHFQRFSHLHTLKILHSDECPCGTGPQTPNHILQSCPTLDALRCQTWPSPVDTHRKLWGLVETLWQTKPYSPHWRSSMAGNIDKEEVHLE